jgi:hypothetical protein
MAGGGAAAWAACATGGLTGGEAQLAQEWSGVLNTAQVAALGAEGDGDRELDATQRLERRNDGGETPPLALLPEFGVAALPPCLLCRHGAGVVVHIHTDAACSSVRHG